MTTRTVINTKERNLLLGSLIGGSTVIFGIAAGIIYLLTRPGTNDANWIFIFALTVAFIAVLPKSIYMLMDFLSKEIDEGESRITDKGREFSSAFNRYIRLDTYGKKKIRVQYIDRDKMSVGDTIKFRITPKTKTLVSFEARR